jgi:DNA-binding NtrC family response regulator
MDRCDRLRRAVVVENRLGLGTLVSSALGRAFEVCCVPCSTEADTAAIRTRADVVIRDLDIEAPHGAATLAILEEADPRAQRRALLVTGVATHEGDVPAWALVLKPIELDALREAVSDVLSGVTRPSQRLEIWKLV